MRDDVIPFDLRSLEAFLSVCDQGTMAAAARVLGVTQPAVSQTIAELEERTRAVLFDRKVRPLGLTPAGAVLRQRARALIADARQISPLLREVRRGRLPVLRVGFVESFSRALVPELSMHLSTVSESVSFVWGLTADHVDAILNRRLDIFIGIDDFELPDGLMMWPLIKEPYIVVTPPDVARVASLGDLPQLCESKAFIRYSARTKVGREIERHLSRVGIDLPRAQEFDTPYGVAATVAQGGGWAISTPLCIYEAAVADNLRFHPLPGPGLTRRLALIARRHELGRLPMETAQFGAELLRGKFLPAILRRIPWLAEQMVLGTGMVAATLAAAR
ncbi:MAG: LysR family transcriptional regulator [Acetobacteraceae bacterium]